MNTNLCLQACTWLCPSARRWKSSCPPVSCPQTGWKSHHLSPPRGPRTAVSSSSNRNRFHLGSWDLWGSVHREKITMLCYSYLMRIHSRHKLTLHTPALSFFLFFISLFLTSHAIRPCAPIHVKTNFFHKQSKLEGGPDSDSRMVSWADNNDCDLRINSD